MNATQPNLFVERSEISGEWLANTLRAAGRWCRASELCSLAGLPDNEDSKRGIRAMATVRDDVISGNSGYIFADCATLDELQHAIARRHSQISVEARHLIRLKRYLHARLAKKSQI